MITVQDKPFGADVRPDSCHPFLHHEFHVLVFRFLQVNVPTRARDRFKQQLEKQEQIARKRRELESLEAQLSRIRKEGRN